MSKSSVFYNVSVRIREKVGTPASEAKVRLVKALLFAVDKEYGEDWKACIVISVEDPSHVLRSVDAPRQP